MNLINTYHKNLDHCPIEIFSCLNSFEKNLLSEIKNSDNGFFEKKNKYLSDLFEKSIRTIQRAISKLKSTGYVSQVSFNGRNRILKTNITLDNNLEEFDQNNYRNQMEHVIAKDVMADMTKSQNVMADQTCQKLEELSNDCAIIAPDCADKTDMTNSQNPREVSWQTCHPCHGRNDSTMTGKTPEIERRYGKNVMADMTKMSCLKGPPATGKISSTYLIENKNIYINNKQQQQYVLDVRDPVVVVSSKNSVEAKENIMDDIPKISILPCIDKLNIPYKDKLSICKRFTAPTIERAVEAYHSQAHNVKSIPAWIYAACARNFEPPINPELLKKENHEYALSLTKKVNLRNGDIFDVLNKCVEIGYANGVASHIDSISYTDPNFKNKLSESIKKRRLEISLK